MQQEQRRRVHLYSARRPPLSLSLSPPPRPALPATIVCSIAARHDSLAVRGRLTSFFISELFFLKLVSPLTDGGRFAAREQENRVVRATCPAPWATCRCQWAPGLPCAPATTSPRGKRDGKRATRARGHAGVGDARRSRLPPASLFLARWSPSAFDRASTSAAKLSTIACGPQPRFTRARCGA